jgi:hypothetical protein
MFQNFISSISKLNSVTLTDLDSVSLLNRIDCKFVLNEENLEKILPCLIQNYSILKINDCSIFRYENNYFDTPDLQFYKDHHNGYLNRIKVRSRKYVESNLCFFEIKKKEKTNRTSKYRSVLPGLIATISEEQKEIIQSFTRKNVPEIELILRNNFNRITLVDSLFTERVTIDLNIHFINKNEAFQLDKVAIIEIKQSKTSHSSPLGNFLKENNFREQSISKYIFGIISLMPSIKKNNFLPLIKSVTNL